MSKANSQNTGVDTAADARERGRRGSPPAHAELVLPKNRSTPNLANARGPDRSRVRFSFDAGSLAAELDTISRSVHVHICAVVEADNVH